MLFGYGVPEGDGQPLPQAPYVVIDLETTGLTPEEDRVVEIAMARVQDGRQVDEWATLIDPGRDPGPTFLHHISSAMLDGAPRFSDIAGEILSRLDGAVVVAHHAAFEEKFLEAEFARLGLRDQLMPALCTLQLARVVLAAPNYKLATCCEVAGIDLSDAHTALGDVRATAVLLPRLLALAPEIRYPVGISALPRLVKRRGPRTRVTNLRMGTDGWMRSLLSKLPYSMDDHDPVGAEPYLDALGEALAEGRLTREKTRRLGRLAGRAGMGAAQVVELHRRFLDGLRDAALVHDLVTADELRQRLQAGGYRLAVNISRGLAAAVVGPHDALSLKAQRAAQLGLKVIGVGEVDAFLGMVALPAPVAPAGWYPDPTGRFVYRYWTGQGWTEHVSPGDGTMLTDAPTAHA